MPVRSMSCLPSLALTLVRLPPHARAVTPGRTQHLVDREVYSRCRTLVRDAVAVKLRGDNKHAL